MIPTIQAGQFGRRSPFDPYRAWCKLLLHCEGTNGSTSFPDNGPLAKTVTAFGNAQVDTSQSSLGAASLLLDGTGDYLRVPNSGDYDFGAGDFFIRLRIKSGNTTANNYAVIGAWGSSQSSWVLYKDASVNYMSLYASSNGTSWDIYSGQNMSGLWTAQSAFTELGFGRKGNTVGLWQDGASTNTESLSATLWAGGSNLYIGADTGGGAGLNGRLDEIHILKGVCPITPGSSYIPAKIPFPNAG